MPPVRGAPFPFLTYEDTQAVYFGFSIGEISCPTKYFREASSISFKPSVIYGLGVLRTAARFFLQKRGFASYRIFSESGKRLLDQQPEVVPRMATG